VRTWLVAVEKLLSLTYLIDTRSMEDLGRDLFGINLHHQLDQADHDDPPLEKQSTPMAMAYSHHKNFGIMTPAIAKEKQLEQLGVAEASVHQR
jgi:hypothetical protein